MYSPVFPSLVNISSIYHDGKYRYLPPVIPRPTLPLIWEISPFYWISSEISYDFEHFFVQQLFRNLFSFPRHMENNIRGPAPQSLSWDVEPKWKDCLKHYFERLVLNIDYQIIRSFWYTRLSQRFCNRAIEDRLLAYNICPVRL